MKGKLLKDKSVQLSSFGLCLRNDFSDWNFSKSYDSWSHKYEKFFRVPRWLTLLVKNFLNFNLLVVPAWKRNLSKFFFFFFFFFFEKFFSYERKNFWKIKVFNCLHLDSASETISVTDWNFSKSYDSWSVKIFQSPRWLALLVKNFWISTY